MVNKKNAMTFELILIKPALSRYSDRLVVDPNKLEPSQRIKKSVEKTICLTKSAKLIPRHKKSKT